MKYGFIGCGNMGGAIAKALAKTTTDFILSDRSGKGAALARQLGAGYGSVRDAAGCPIVFLGVKPYLMRQVLAPLQPVFAANKPLLITMAAGLSMAQIEEFAGCKLPVIRIMPNTPVAVGKGLLPYCRNELVTEQMVDTFLQDLAFAGTLDVLDESLMDAVSALSGSGPAFVYMFMEAMADGAVACGIPRAKALNYAAATVIGAAETMLATGQHPGALKDAVCSPKGSTIVGVRTLEEHGFRGAVMDCVEATFRRNLEMGK